MAGLDPAIHVDARLKAGHDGPGRLCREARVRVKALVYKRLTQSIDGGKACPVEAMIIAKELEGEIVFQYASSRAGLRGSVPAGLRV